MEISKIVIKEFLYDYVKPKCGEKARLCYMGTVNVYVETAKDVWYFILF